MVDRRRCEPLARLVLPAVDVPAFARLEGRPAASCAVQIRVLDRVRRFAAGHVHTVWNDGPAAATSIHAYSPPLHSMTYYTRDLSTGLHPTHVELVPKTAVP